MSTETLQPGTPPPENKSSFSIELALVIGLPLAAVCFASSAAYIAFVKGFTALPEPAPAAVVAQHH